MKKGGFVVGKNWLGKFPLNDDTKKNWASRIIALNNKQQQQRLCRDARSSLSRRGIARARLPRRARTSSVVSREVVALLLFFFRESKRERKKGKNDNLSGGVPL